MTIVHSLGASAPPVRNDFETRQELSIIDQSHFHILCQSMPVPVLVLDDQFRAVVANTRCLEMLGFENLEVMVGIRLEISSPLRSDFGKCQRITSEKMAKPLGDVWIDAKLLALDRRNYYVVALTDLSQQKRQRSMQQLFFHDILNTAGGMQGISGVLLEAEPEEASDLQSSVHNLAAQLVDEITSQRDFMAAENGDLEATSKPLSSNRFLQSLASTYCNHPSSGQRDIRILEPDGFVSFKSDPILLKRVLGNMVKNALEASVYPEVITLQSYRLEEKKGKPGRVVFSVHNPGHIPEENQRLIFQHSFSTKGVGRGLGTFSMRLLAEKYLGGQVSFTTDPATGTTFYITLPLAGL